MLRLFADVANLNVILAPDVKGKVTVRMVNIPWDQAMDMILKMNGLGYVFEDNIIRIASVSALTKEAEEETQVQGSEKEGGGPDHPDPFRSIMQRPRKSNPR